MLAYCKNKKNKYPKTKFKVNKMPKMNQKNQYKS